MTYQEVFEMLDSISPDLPVTYYQWDEGTTPSLPYLVFYYPSRNDFSADNKNYAKFTQLNIELYTDNKEFDLECMVEEALENADIYYTKEEQYIEDERMYEVLYMMEVLIDG